jgi:hypothetical protein
MKQKAVPNEVRLFAVVVGFGRLWLLGFAIALLGALNRRETKACAHPLPNLQFNGDR